MTELLFQTDAYLKEFDATVIAVDGERVALDRTAFYARSGGQPSDHGILRVDGPEYDVLDSRSKVVMSGTSLIARGLELARRFTLP